MLIYLCNLWLTFELCCLHCDFVRLIVLCLLISISYSLIVGFLDFLLMLCTIKFCG